MRLKHDSVRVSSLCRNALIAVFLFIFVAQTNAQPCDLIIFGSPAVSPNWVPYGSPATVRYRIRNQGLGVAGPSHTKIKIENGSGLVISEAIFPTPSLNPNSTSTFQNNEIGFDIQFGPGTGVNLSARIVIDALGELNQSNILNDVVAPIPFFCFKQECGMWYGASSGFLPEALATFNGNLVAGGDFLTAGGQPCRNIAMWNGTTWEPLGSGTSDTVLAMTVFEGDLIAAGRFTEVGERSAFRIARWDGTNWHPMGNAWIDGQIRTLTVFQGSVIVGGDFTSIGNQNFNHVARWNGVAWNPLANGFPGGTSVSVRATCNFNDSLVVSVHKNNFPLEDSGYVAQWNGTSWQVLGAETPNGFATGFAIHNGKLVGAFYDHVSYWSGQSWVQLGGPLFSSSVASYHGTLYAGAGGVLKWNNQSWIHLPGLSSGSDVDVLHPHDSKLLACGWTISDGNTHMAHFDDCVYQTEPGVGSPPIPAVCNGQPGNYCPNGFNLLPGKDYLVVVTHGWQRDGGKTGVNYARIQHSADSIAQRIADPQSGLDHKRWQVLPLDWTGPASTGPHFLFDAFDAQRNASAIGKFLGEEIRDYTDTGLPTGKHYKYVHLIAHGAGGAMINRAAGIVHSRWPGIKMMSTFLDGLTTILDEGQGTIWSDFYFAKDTSGPFTDGAHENTYDVNVTWLDPSVAGVECENVPFYPSSHDWPFDFYCQTINFANPFAICPTTTSPSTWQGNGFARSMEGGNFNTVNGEPVWPAAPLPCHNCPPTDQVEASLGTDPCANQPPENTYVSTPTISPTLVVPDNGCSSSVGPPFQFTITNCPLASLASASKPSPA